jgi:hypothetical protein
MREKGMIFNFAYIVFALACVLLVFIPVATMTDKDMTKYTIISYRLSTGLMIIILAVLAFVFSFFKRQKIIIMFTGMGFGIYGIYAFVMTSKFESMLINAMRAKQAAADIAATAEAPAAKITYSISPILYIFGICAIFAFGMAALTYLTTNDE